MFKDGDLDTEKGVHQIPLAQLTAPFMGKTWMGALVYIYILVSELCSTECLGHLVFRNSCVYECLKVR